MKINFQHNMSAHCENGVTSNLLRFYGIDLSEPMVFGLGSGLFFSHMPFIKLNDIPVTSFRPWPGAIFKRVTSILGVEYERRKYTNKKQQAMLDLDTLLMQGVPAGMLVGVFNLPYFPKEYRFHFNAHNITVIGKEGDQYYVSDPVMEKIETLSSDELLKVRYAKGTYPPKGRMYHITKAPQNIDIKSAIVKSIRRNCKDMLTIPLPMFGVEGIRYLSKRLRNWPVKLGPDKAAIYLSQVIRMLEEIGTGGAGFRFIYAAFLQESAGILQQPWLNDLSKEMTDIGDKWREFAYNAARIYKKRDDGGISYDMLADILLSIADREEKVFRQLKKIEL
jgi:hypothetical protein